MHFSPCNKKKKSGDFTEGILGTKSMYAYKNQKLERQRATVAQSHFQVIEQIIRTFYND